MTCFGDKIILKGCTQEGKYALSNRSRHGLHLSGLTVNTNRATKGCGLLYNGKAKNRKVGL